MYETDHGEGTSSQYLYDVRYLGRRETGDGPGEYSNATRRLHLQWSSLVERKSIHTIRSRLNTCSVRRPKKGFSTSMKPDLLRYLSGESSPVSEICSYIVMVIKIQLTVYSFSSNIPKHYSMIGPWTGRRLCDSRAGACGMNRAMELTTGLTISNQATPTTEDDEHMIERPEDWLMDIKQVAMWNGSLVVF